MTDKLLRRIVVPVANVEDTVETVDGMKPYIDDETELLVVLHVIEQTEGYPDPSSPEALKERAEEMFELAAERLGDHDAFETELRYGTDIIEEINNVADDWDATAILFKPRGAGRLKRILRDSEHKLLTETTRPVIVVDESGGGITEVSG